MSALHKAAETTHQLDGLSQSNFGAEISTSSTIHIPKPGEDLITMTHPAVLGHDLVPLAQNFDHLKTMTGNRFGLLTIVGTARVIYPGIITERSDDTAIHFTYLEDPIDPTNIRELTPIQRTVLDGGLGMQDKKVGTEHAHGNLKKTATEVGHTAMAMRTLTDPTTMRAVMAGKHVAHDWGHSSTGITPVLTERDATKPGAFDQSGLQSGNRAVTFKSVTLGRNAPALLIKSEAFEEPAEDLGVDNTKLLIGLGLLAAQQQHGTNTQEMMLRTMDRI